MLHMNRLRVGLKAHTRMVAAGDHPTRHSQQYHTTGEREQWGVPLQPALETLAREDNTIPPNIILTQAVVKVKQRRKFMDFAEDLVEQHGRCLLLKDQQQRTPDEEALLAKEPWLQQWKRVHIYFLGDLDADGTPFVVWVHSFKGAAPRDAQVRYACQRSHVKEPYDTQKRPANRGMPQRRIESAWLPTCQSTATGVET